MSGRGAISNDRERIKELFSVAAKAWWDASDDPNIRLRTVTPDGAECWDGRGKVASMISVTVVAATGGRPNVARMKKFQ